MVGSQYHGYAWVTLMRLQRLMKRKAGEIKTLHSNEKFL